MLCNIVILVYGFHIPLPVVKEVVEHIVHEVIARVSSTDRVPHIIERIIYRDVAPASSEAIRVSAGVKDHLASLEVSSLGIVLEIVDVWKDLAVEISQK